MGNKALTRAPIAVFLVFVALIATSPQALAQSQIVKKSNSDICHPPESSYYERTRNYRPFETLQACLDSGGRLPANLSRSAVSKVSSEPLPRSTTRSASSSGYDRSRFGQGWDDADGDCQDSRAEALIATSNTQVRFADSRRCRVTTGRWVSPFTENIIQNSSEIDIDHVVPLRWAWDRGAAQWSQQERENFANDPVNLIPVEASLNRSKGARGPDEWLPPSGQCSYVARFVRIVRVYGLNMKASEERSIQALLDRCQDN
ncbi:HNH endonuclease family protein [Pseudohongiella acticola]|uniref:HNH endonuclease family protein n=1 Tax=Pseudohongiella acticola TaxID=1524254 RepID=UPI0009F5B921|nr:HNH endonuclease family protein [Pseudohongiella acticola]